MNQVQLQERVEAFFRSQSERPFSISTRDCCSEMARLVGSWVKEEEPTAEVVIVQGVGEVQTECNHEVVAMWRDNHWLLIDPTIWQVFPSASTIVVGVADSRAQALDTLVHKYGGAWRVTERVGLMSDQDVFELQDTLREIIASNSATSAPSI